MFARWGALGSLFLFAGSSLSACDTVGPGTHIQVSGVGSAATVELLVGDTSCGYGCTGGHPISGTDGGISWAAGMQLLEGEIHEQLWTTTTPVSAGSATVILEATSGDSADAMTLPIVAFVGFSSDGEVTGMAVLDGVELQAGDVLPVTLTPVTQIDAPPAFASLTQEAHFWASGSAQCIAYFAPGKGTPDFIVPADDHDCDGYRVTDSPIDECNDFMANLPLTGTSWVCVAMATAMGGCDDYMQSCRDGAGLSCDITSNVAPQSCYPAAVCTTCATTANASPCVASGSRRSQVKPTTLESTVRCRSRRTELCAGLQRMAIPTRISEPRFRTARTSSSWMVQLARLQRLTRSSSGAGRYLFLRGFKSTRMARVA